MDRSRAKIDLTPPPPSTRLPRGVSPLAHYDLFNPNVGQFVAIDEFVYETAMGTAHLVVFPSHSVQEGLEQAESLLRNQHRPWLKQAGCCGTVNTVKNYQDLYSGSPLNVVIGRSGCYSESDENKLADIITGKKIAPSKFQRQMTSRPGLVFPYHPYEADQYVRLKPGYVPPAAKIKYLTPYGTQHNEILYAGHIVNGRRPELVQQIRQDVEYMLWLTEGEKKANCLAMVPLLTGIKMDVIGIPGVWMWGSRQENERTLAPELMEYTYVNGARHRIVGILFDQDSWKNVKVADALLKLSAALRKVGALVVVGIIPPGPNQKGIDDYFQKHCRPSATQFDLNPLLDILDNAIYVDRDYSVTYPTIEEEFQIKPLAQRAEAYAERQQSLLALNFSQVASKDRQDLIRFANPAIYDGLTADQAWAAYSAYSPEVQQEVWEKLMRINPFARDLDALLDRFIPAIFRSRHAEGIPATLCSHLQSGSFSPKQLSGVNQF